MQINVEINCDSQLWNGFVESAESIINDSAKRVFDKVGFAGNIDYVEISILLTDNESMRILNNDYRGKDKPTNVLSFPAELLTSGSYAEIPNEVILGDLAFAHEVIDNESKEQEKSFKSHFVHLAVHGILHLLGYDHIEDDEAEKMESIEIEVLSQLGVPNPY